VFGWIHPYTFKKAHFVILRPRTRKDPTRVIRFHRWLPTLLQRHFTTKIQAVKSILLMSLPVRTNPIVPGEAVSL
jgi:hypothetical protein